MSQLKCRGQRTTSAMLVPGFEQQTLLLTEPSYQPYLFIFETGSCVFQVGLQPTIQLKRRVTLNLILMPPFSKCWVWRSGSVSPALERGGDRFQKLADQPV